MAEVHQATYTNTLLSSLSRSMKPLSSSQSNCSLMRRGDGLKSCLSISISSVCSCAAVIRLRVFRIFTAASYTEHFHQMIFPINIAAPVRAMPSAAQSPRAAPVVRDYRPQPTDTILSEKQAKFRRTCTCCRPMMLTRPRGCARPILLMTAKCWLSQKRVESVKSCGRCASPSVCITCWRIFGNAVSVCGDDLL